MSILDSTPQSPNVPDSKKCNRCGAVKLLNEFSRHRGHVDGRAGQCKACVKQDRERRSAEIREYQREYYAKNQEKLRSDRKAYYYANREKELQSNRERYHSNKEYHRQYHIKYSAEHQEHLRAVARRYNETHKDARKKWHAAYRTTEVGKIKHRLSQSARRAKTVEVDAISGDEIYAIRAAQTDKQGRLICWRCGKPITDTPHLDHWIPLAGGGTNDAGNLHYMHAHCNLTKSSKHPTEIGRLL